MTNGTVTRTIHGPIKLRGVTVQVGLAIQDGEIMLIVPNGTDLTNWFHAVTIINEPKYRALEQLKAFADKPPVWTLPEQEKPPAVIPSSFKIGNMRYTVLSGGKWDAQLNGAERHADVNTGSMELLVNTTSAEQRQKQGLFISIIRAAFMESGLIQKKHEKDDLIGRLGYALLQFLMDNPIDWIKDTSVDPPAVFRIGCTMFELDQSEEGQGYLDGTGLWGAAVYDECKIHVDKDIPATKRPNTVIHEIIHAILNSYALENTEEFVYQFTPVLHQLLRENDFTWIREAELAQAEEKPKSACEGDALCTVCADSACPVRKRAYTRE